MSADHPTLEEYEARNLSELDKNLADLEAAQIADDEAWIDAAEAAVDRSYARLDEPCAAWEREPELDDLEMELG